MSNVLISVPSESIRYKIRNGLSCISIGDNEVLIPAEWVYGDESTRENWNEFFNSCIKGHMYIDNIIIKSKKDLLR